MFFSDLNKKFDILEEKNILSLKVVGGSLIYVKEALHVYKVEEKKLKKDRMNIHVCLPATSVTIELDNGKENMQNYDSNDANAH